MTKGDWAREAVFLGALVLVLTVFALFIVHPRAGALAGASAAGFGAVLGVVYTAGGLVIVAVSVFSLTLLPRTVRQHAIERWSEMRATLQEEMKHLVLASNLFMRAKWGNGSLNRADDLVRRALSIYEPLAGARIWLAKDYHHDVRTRFRRVHIPDTLVYNDEVSDVTWNVAQGLQWLREARRTQDGVPADMIAMETELRAMLGPGDRAAVRRLLRQLRALKHGADEVHLDPVMLLHAFNESEPSIRTLAAFLGLKLLLDVSEVALGNKNTDQASEFSYLAIPKRVDLPGALAPCRIWVHVREGGAWAALPHVVDGRLEYEMFPPSQDPRRAKLVSESELAKELAERSWLLSADWPLATTYRDEPVTPVIHEVKIGGATWDGTEAVY